MALHFIPTPPSHRILLQQFMASPFIRTFWALERKFPGLRIGIWKRFYNTLARRLPQTDWTFMNYGFLDPEAPLPEVDPSEETHRTCIQLYVDTLSGESIEGKDVLEVGSGRGGGSAWLAKNLHPESMIGIDLAAEAVAFCQRTHCVAGANNLQYKQGSADQLPLDDASIDMVINVESCHHYPSMEKFLAEVYRVLRPGGTLGLTDYRRAGELHDLDAAIKATAFVVEQRRDITAEVVHALDHDHEHKETLIRERVPGRYRKIIRTFAGNKGTAIYNDFSSRALVYVTWLLRKPS